MRLKPEEIQVGDVFESVAGGLTWEIVATHPTGFAIKCNDTTLLVSTLLCSSYNFIHSRKYSNVLPYPDRS